MTALRSRIGARAALAGVAVLLLLVVVLDTRVVSPAEQERLNAPAFDAETYGREAFPKAARTIARDATEIGTLAPAVEEDEAAAAREYGYDLGSGSYAFPVRATGEVTSVDEEFVELDVPDVPRGTEVRIPLGAAVSGTPVRDAAGIAFGDFAGQTDYQSAANQFKLQIERRVLRDLDPDGLDGERVTVEGAYASGGPPGSFIVQPTRIEVGG